MEKLFSVPLISNLMYLRGDGKEKQNGIIGKNVSTDTYFGSFPCEAYYENTTIRALDSCVRLKGTGIIELRHLTEQRDQVVGTIHFKNNSFETIRLPVKLSDFSTGCLYLNITGETELEEIWYEGEGEEQNTRIAVILCTFHREKEVSETLRSLSQTLVKDPLLQNGMKVICVDNGQTISDVPPATHLVKNKNYGGSGGYARGMLEALNERSFTHFWLMDDDIRIEPAVLRRVFTFLQHRKKTNIQLAAGMFSFEKPTVQQEATAEFHGYTFVSNGCGLDFRERTSLLKNRIKSNEHTYGGWWSLVTPATDVLPMPFFIKMDDVEYGLRTPDQYVVMNGFGVWHEAFAKKGNAWAEYYTTRNTLIIQALYPELPGNPLKMMGIRLMKALAYGEPNCMRAACRGAEDYCSGVDAFCETDPEEKHRQIMSEFGAVLSTDMTRKKMLPHAVLNILRPKNWESIKLFFYSVIRLKKNQQNKEWKKLSSKEFWKKYLGVNNG